MSEIITIKTGRKTKREWTLEYDVEDLRSQIKQYSLLFKENTYVKAWNKLGIYLTKEQYNNEYKKTFDVLNSLDEELLKTKLKEFPKKSNNFDLDEIITLKDVNCCVYDKDENTWSLRSLSIVPITKTKLKIVFCEKVILGMQ